MSRILTIAVMVFGALSAPPAVAGDAAVATASVVADALLIQSDVTRAPYLRLEGFVTNQSVYDLQNVRLHVDVLDPEGRLIAEASGWAFGNVLSGGRTYFVIALPAPGSRYQISVSSFDLLARRPG